MIKDRIILVLTLGAVFTLQERPPHFFAKASLPSVKFTFGTPDNPFICNEIVNEISQFWCGGIYSTNQTGALELMYPPPVDRQHQNYSSLWGMAIWSKPMIMFDTDTKQWRSFTTYFQFYIKSDSAAPADHGDGMAFVMLSTSEFAGSGGSNFGLYDENSKQKVKTVAVEFDTFKNYDFNRTGDPDGNHVGIDLEVLKSRNTTSATTLGIELFDHLLFAWIDYNSFSSLLEVRISYTSIKPHLPLVTFSVSLSDVYGSDSQVYVGFSASNGAVYGIYQILSWEFEHFPNLATTSPTPAEPPPLASSLDLPPESPSGRSSVVLIAGTSVGSIAILSLAGLVLFLAWKRRNGKSASKSESGIQNILNLGLGPAGQSLRYSYKLLSVATSQFREESKLGQGGFGSVYQGVIPTTGQAVAVKRVSTDSKQGLKEFLAEVSIISELRHRNIVKLLGWCIHRGSLMLVYELMPNGSLDQALFHPAEGSVLSWKLRFSILRGAAEALQYLHDGTSSRQQIIHRDFKSSNILLDEKFNAMLGDFGLARIMDRNQDPAITMVAGTYGFLAPETTMTARFTENTDVYAFGAVALEIVTGEPAYSPWLCEEERMLVDCVWKRLEVGNLMTSVDHRLRNEYDADEVEVVLLLGLLCSHPDPNVRPSMRKVLEILSGNVAVPPIPMTKPSPHYDDDEGHHYRVKPLKSIPETESFPEGEEVSNSSSLSQ